MDWGRGYTSMWRVYRVNMETWADGSEVGGVTAASVERNDGSSDPLMETGSLTVETSASERFDAGYYRIVLYPQQNGIADRVDVATLYCESSHGDTDRGRTKHTVNGSSTLYPASIAVLATGSYFPEGAGCMAESARMLRSCVKAPVTIDSDDDPVISQNVVYDEGTTVLDAVHKVLDAGQCVVQVHGDGSIHLLRKPTEPSLLLDRANARLVEPSMSYDYDLTDVPNRYVAKQDNHIETAVNDDPNSEVSTVFRGFEHDEYDSSPVRVDGETLYGFACRMLEERSVVQDKRTYSRKWWPEVLPGDVVRGSMPSVGLDGDMRVIRQSLDCGHGIRVTEEAAREVRLWQRN